MERAFIVNKGSEMYKTFFLAKAEKKRGYELADPFFEEYGLFVEQKEPLFKLSECLCIKLTDSIARKYEKHLKIQKIDGLHVFKRKSGLNLEWISKVYSKVDHSIINKSRSWAFGCTSGRYQYALWEHNSDIYGIVESMNEVNLPEGTTEIKVSEYYSIMELSEKSI